MLDSNTTTSVHTHSVTSCVFRVSGQTALNSYLWVWEPDELRLHKQISCHSLETYLFQFLVHSHTHTHTRRKSVHVNP